MNWYRSIARAGPKEDPSGETPLPPLPPPHATKALVATGVVAAAVAAVAVAVVVAIVVVAAAAIVVEGTATSGRAGFRRSKSVPPPQRPTQSLPTLARFALAGGRGW